LTKISYAYLEIDLMIRSAIDRILYTPTGQFLVSALFGLALALMFRRVCKDNCVSYHAPYVKDIEGKVFKLEDTCYVYTPYMVDCQKTDKEPLEVYDINSEPVNKIGRNVPQVISNLTA
jgi:hypothetical protein